MPKLTVGIFFCLLVLSGCATSKPVANSTVPQPASATAKPLPLPPPGAVTDRASHPPHLAPTDILPTKGESEQQVDPSKLRRSP
jgi:hypothetical protein